MPTGFFEYITQGCQSLSATAAPSVQALGVRMLIALATIMLAWYGIQEALASSRGESGLSTAKFFQFFMLISFAYCFVQYYETSIPGIGVSIKGFIDGGTQNLVQIIGADGTTTMLTSLHLASGNIGPGLLNTLMSPYYAIVYFFIQLMLGILIAIISAIVAYGAIASTIVGLLGPVFIPWMVYDKLEFLFWGWVKAYLGFSFYKVIAAATLNVLSAVMTNYYLQLQNIADPATMVENIPLLILLVIVNVYVLIKIPAMTQTIFSGSTGGHDGGVGLAMMAMMAK